MTIEPTIDEEHLTAIERDLAGNRRGHDRASRVPILARGRGPAARPLLLRLATDRSETPSTRRAATEALYRFGGTQAVGDLRELATGRPDEATVGALAVCLGRLGEIDDVARLRRLSAAVGTGPLRTRLDFAKTLLSYRLGEATHPVDIPDETRLARPDADASEVTIQRADRSLTTNGLDALAATPIAVPVVGDEAVMIRCQGEQLLWLWTDSGGSRPVDVVALVLRSLPQTKSRRARPIDFHLSLIALRTSSDLPTRSHVNLTLHRPVDGRLLHAGVMTGRHRLELASVDQPAVRPVDLAISSENGRLKVNRGRSALRLDGPRRPRPAPRVARV